MIKQNDEINSKEYYEEEFEKVLDIMWQINEAEKNGILVLPEEIKKDIDGFKANFKFIY